MFCIDIDYSLLNNMVNGHWHKVVFIILLNILQRKFKTNERA